MLEAWASRMLELIRDGEYAEIVLVVRNVPSATLAANSVTTFGKYSPARLVRALANRFLSTTERLIVGRKREFPDAFALVDASSIWEGAEDLPVSPKKSTFSDHFDERDVQKIKEKDLDVLIRLGFRVLRGGILNAARNGVWSLHHGDNRVNRGGPPGYWEVMESVGETGSVLQVLTEDLDNGRVIYRSFSSTDDMSLAATRNRYYWKSLQLIPRRLRELHAMGTDAFSQAFEQTLPSPQFYDRRLYRSPDVSTQVVLLARKLVQKIHRKYCELRFVDQWGLKYCFSDDISTVLWRFESLLPPVDRIWADPFVVCRDDRHYIFFEEMLFSERKGHIAAIEITRDGPVGDPVKVLVKPYHLSYPFIFEYEGDYFMVPESIGNRTVELYKCTGFPDQWTFQTNLMHDCEAADATLFEWEGKWWMFANMQEIEGGSRWDELYLFYADSPFSTDWNPHPRNPIVSDVKSSRPAGRIFVRDGHIFRPAQNSSHRYGYGFNLCEIIKLTETEYEERIVSCVEPKWQKNLLATHTFNYASGLTVIDAQIRRKK